MNLLFPVLSAVYGCHPDHPTDRANADSADGTHPSGDSGADSGAPDPGADSGGEDSGAGDSGAEDSDAADTGTADSGTAADPCAGLTVCDDFEGAAAGGPPDPAVWEVVSPDCSGAGTVTIDAGVAHAGAQSLRVDGGSGYCDHVFVRGPVPAKGTLYARFYVRFAAAFGDRHTTWVSMPDTHDGDAPLRMGGQSGVFMWNRASDDATLPVLSPAGIATSVAPEADRWYRVEFAVDPAGTLQTWVDGEAVAGLAVDGVPTPEVDEPWLRADWRPDLASFALGWESYGGDAMTLWFDDVAVGSAPIGP